VVRPHYEHEGREGRSATRDCQNGKHPSTKCKETILRADDVNRLCGFFFYDEFTIHPSPTGNHEYGKKLFEIADDLGFRLGNRREAIRDILLAPLSHLTNAQVISNPNMWRAIGGIIAALQEFSAPLLCWRELPQISGSGRQPTPPTTASTLLTVMPTCTCCFLERQLINCLKTTVVRA